MIDVPQIGNDAMTLKQLARTLGVHQASCHRWRLHGVVNRSTGERVKLRAFRVGGTFRVAVTDAEEFIRALNGGPANAKPDASRSAAAEAELRRLGA